MVGTLGSLLLTALPLHADPGDDIIPLVGWRYLSAWGFEWFGLILLAVPAALYLWGVITLKRRGDAWSAWRTFSFIGLGGGAIFLASFSFLGVYDTVLFWPHMVQHMLYNMVAPVFLVAGAPMTLALRALPKRPRGWLLTVVHSWPAKALMFPPLTTLLMVASPFLLYMTGWYNLTLRDDVQHDLLHLWMVIIGFLFFFPLLGVDPVPIRMPYPIRVLLFMLTMPFHAFLGVTIMGSETLIAEEWYLAFNRSWGLSPMDDQTWAGALMWATGDLTAFACMSVLFYQWVKESAREARRVDRALDRREQAAAAGAQHASGGGVGYDADDPSGQEST
ncbi:MAG: cytochrome c oxidase assembly protein [Arachnia sp.]